jgi:hypothetical protein
MYVEHFDMDRNETLSMHAFDRKEANVLAIITDR